MIQRMLVGALFAGFAAGLLAALLHFAFVQNVLLLGEQYESGALAHFAGGETAGEGHGHEHAHEHAPGDEAPTLTRNVLTVIFYALTYAAYALLLVAGFALASHFGRETSPAEGVLWGIAGFVSFQFAPAMGLPPELPGTVGADLGERQIWWWGTVLATGGGLALLAYGRGFAAWLAAGVLLAAPHAFGAPAPEGFHGTAPPELAAMFAARVLGTALVTWAFMGWALARLWRAPSAA